MTDQPTYTSSSKGEVLIADMAYPHLHHALNGLPPSGREVERLNLTAEIAKRDEETRTKWATLYAEGWRTFENASGTWGVTHQESGDHQAKGLPAPTELAAKAIALRELGL